MTTEFKVPDLGENVDEGDIVSVMVKEGDEIQAEQNVMEIETVKAVVELPCPFAGRIVKVHVQQGSKVKVGDPLLTLEGSDGAKKKSAAGKSSAKKKEPNKAPQSTDDDSPAPAAKESAPEPDEPAQQEAEPAEATAAPAETKAAPTPRPVKARASDTPTKAAPQTPAGKIPPAGPATRRLARELGVDLAVVAGSGPAGRITEEDVKAAVRDGAVSPRTTSVTASAVPLPEGVDEKDQWGLVRRQKLTAIRKAIATNMAHSSSTIPHVTNFDEADITELERIRRGGMSDYVNTEIKLTMMAFVMKAVAQSLKLHPMLNASIDMESEELIYKQYVNIGVAVDTDRGLVVPVVRDVDRMRIPAIAQALTAVADQARAAKFKLADLAGGTFTISNLGAVGGVASTPIINPPEVAVLLVGRSRKKPVVVEGDAIQVRLMMPLSLSYDHRVVDGATAARFLNEVINYLKVPGRLLLAP